MAIIWVPMFASADELLEIRQPYDDPNHLLPASISKLTPPTAEHLFVSDGRLGRYVLFASNGPVISVAVHGDDENGYGLTVTISPDLNTENIKVTRSDRTISRDLAVAVQRAWGRMLLRTGYPKRPLTRTFDGGLYYFSVFVRGVGTLEGEIMNPMKGLPSEMAKIGSSLSEFALSTDSDESAMIRKIRAFELSVVQSEQDGARQPATASDSKSEGSDKPKLESEGHSQ